MNIKTTKDYIIEGNMIKKNSNIHVYEKVSDKEHKENIDLIKRYSKLVEYLQDK